MAAPVPGAAVLFPPCTPRTVCRARPRCVRAPQPTAAHASSIARAIDTAPGRRSEPSPAQSPAAKACAQLAAGHPHRLGDLALGRAQAARPRPPPPGSRPSASAGTARPGCRGSATSRTGTPTSSWISRSTQASSDSPASTKPASTENRPSGHTGWRASSTRSAPSCTRQITAGSVRGYSSWPSASHTRCQPAARGCVREPSRPQNRAASCQFRTATADVEQPGAERVQGGAGGAQVRPVHRVLARARVRPAVADRPVRDAVRLAEQYRLLGRGVAGGRHGDAGARCRRCPSPTGPPGGARSTGSVHGRPRRRPVTAPCATRRAAGRRRGAARRRGARPSARAPAGRAGRSARPRRCRAPALRRCRPYRSAATPSRQVDPAQGAQAGTDHLGVAHDHPGERDRREELPAPPPPPRPP